MIRTKAVAKKVRCVKALHVLMMIGWPILVVVATVTDSILFYEYRRAYTPYYDPTSMLMMLIWLLYAYFVMIMMRNSNLQAIATQECDFDAYLECVQYLGKFQFARIRKMQRINLTDVYLIKGDFHAAYANLMQMKDAYPSFNDRTKMLYDYFWCRFYAELEDVQNFHICMNAFRNNWVHNTRVKRKLQNHAMRLLQEMNFLDMMFAGKNDRMKSDMMNLYAAGRIGSRYEFVRYCYFMGRLEYNMNNLEIAKHWFAQTVSFGLQEYMSRRSADFLRMLDEMRVPYAAVPPAQNQYYCNSRNFNMAAGIIGILAGLFLTVLLMLV